MKQIYIIGDIGTEVTLKSVREQLPNSGDIEVVINSGGGEVIEGFAIMNLLKQYKGGDVYTTVIGMAASMASVILQVGKERRAYDNSEIMIHAPFAMVEGTADELTRFANRIREVENNLINVYLERMTVTKDELKQLLSTDSFMGADTAKSLGLVDNVLQNFKVAARMKDETMAKKVYNAVVKALGLIKNEKTGEMYHEGELAVGTAVFSDEDMSISVEDGSYEVNGLTIVVVSGIITEINEITETTEVEEAEINDEMKEEDNESEKILSDLREEIAALKEENDSLKKELEDKDSEIANKVEEINSINAKLDEVSNKVINASAPSKQKATATKATYAQDKELISMFNIK